MVPQKQVCMCMCVSEEEIIQAIHTRKAFTQDDIEITTGAGTGCGRCRRKIIQILQTELDKINSVKKQNYHTST